MLPTPPRAHDAAHALLATIGLSAASGAGSARPVAPHAVHAWQAVGLALSQWCGPFAYHSVLSRAVATVQASSTAMAPLRVTGPLTVTLEGFEDVEALHGETALLDGVQTLLATVITVLDRVIGKDMAMRVVSDAFRPLQLQWSSAATRPETES